jgi:hypothetical protein
MIHLLSAAPLKKCSTFGKYLFKKSGRLRHPTFQRIFGRAEETRGADPRWDTA